MNELVNRLVDGIVKIGTQVAITYSVVPRCRECEAAQVSCPDTCCGYLLPFAVISIIGWLIITGILCNCLVVAYAEDQAAQEQQALLEKEAAAKLRDMEALPVETSEKEASGV